MQQTKHVNWIKIPDGLTLCIFIQKKINFSYRTTFHALISLRSFVNMTSIHNLLLFYYYFILRNEDTEKVGRLPDMRRVLEWLLPSDVNDD